MVAPGRLLIVSVTHVLLELPAAPAGAEPEPGVYVTDGERLFRVVAPGSALFPSVELEDCLTLEVERYVTEELYAMRLSRVVASS